LVADIEGGTWAEGVANKIHLGENEKLIVILTNVQFVGLQ
jgi:hypothetical protein